MKARIRELPNGVRLAVIRNRNLNSMAVLAGVQVGSRHEPMGLWGAAHFVEHVLFKGTKRRPSAKVISQEIESLGGDHNAFTDKEMTGFHVHISKHHGRTAVDVVHDTLTGALLRSSDIEKERPVIREEISMYENNPDMGVWHLSEDVAYKGTGLEHRITGKSVSFSPTMLRDFFRSWYSPERTVVALAGAVDDDTEKLAADLFGSMKRKSAKGPKPFQDSAPMMRPGFSFRAGNTDRLHVVIRFPGVRSSHPSTDRLVLASTALGGYSSSRLFQSLREDKGLCYSVGTGLHSLSDCGAVFVSLSMDRSKFRRAMDALLQEMDSFRKAQKRDEIGRAKNFLRGSRTLEMDSPMTAAQDFVYQTFIDGSYEDPAKRMQKMMQIGMEEVRDVVRKHLDPFVMHVAVVGPEDARDEVNKVMDRIQKKI